MAVLTVSFRETARLLVVLWSILVTTKTLHKVGYYTSTGKHDKFVGPHVRDNYYRFGNIREVLIFANFTRRTNSQI